MSVLEKIAEELRALGYFPREFRIEGLGGDRAVVVEYPVVTGRFRGQAFQLGIALQEQGYPEYPPHFVWVADLCEPRLPVHSSVRFEGADWASFSVPPSDIWDLLPAADKNMKNYVNRHLQRFWDQV